MKFFSASIFSLEPGEIAAAFFSVGFSTRWFASNDSPLSSCVVSIRQAINDDYMSQREYLLYGGGDLGHGDGRRDVGGQVDLDAHVVDRFLQLFQRYCHSLPARGDRHGPCRLLFLISRRVKVAAVVEEEEEEVHSGCVWKACGEQETRRD